MATTTTLTEMGLDLAAETSMGNADERRATMRANARIIMVRWYPNRNQDQMRNFLGSAKSLGKIVMQD